MEVGVSKVERCFWRWLEGDDFAFGTFGGEVDAGAEGEEAKSQDGQK
jgi:hypothetical protein